MATMVAQLMTERVQSCSPIDTINVPAQLMWENDCGCVPVIEEGGGVVGMITDRDICMAAYTQGKRLEEIPVHSAMSGNVLTCAPQESIEAAEAKMRQHQVRRLPVVERGQLVGILSLNDLAVSIGEARARSNGVQTEDVARTLAGISAHRAPEGSLSA